MKGSKRLEVLSIDATVTTRGQVTIPRAIRHALRLETNDKINFLLYTDNTITVSRVQGEVDGEQLVEQFVTMLEKDMFHDSDRIRAAAPDIIARLNALIESE